MLNIVLVEPDIPQNTGTIGRICVNMGATLHLVKPLGFDIDDKAVKRAGLDYWQNLNLIVWDSFDKFLASNPIDSNTHMATTKTDNLYWDSEYKRGDFILFGSETRGLDEHILMSNPSNCMTIPMGDGGRSLNLGVSVGIVAYEAMRQNYDGFEKIIIPNKSA